MFFVVLFVYIVPKLRVFSRLNVVFLNAREHSLQSSAKSKRRLKAVYGTFIVPVSLWVPSPKKYHGHNKHIWLLMQNDAVLGIVTSK